MGDSLADELTALRARAYGADADIHDDPQALARLRALEEEHRARQRRLIEVPSPVPPLPASATAAHAPTFGATAGGGSTPAPTQPTVRLVTAEPTEPIEPTESTGSQPASASRRPRRTLILACAITAVAAAALTVPITLWATSLPAQPYAVLHPIDAEPNQVFFSPESEAQRYEDFLGMHVSTGVGYDQGRCLLIELQPDSDAEFESGVTRGGCSAPGFEAVADVSALDESLSQQVRDELGEFTALRFAVAGDEVHVFVANAPEEPVESS